MKQLSIKASRRVARGAVRRMGWQNAVDMARIIRRDIRTPDDRADVVDVLGSLWNVPPLDAEHFVARFYVTRH